jgi:hypothetical protein
MEKDKRKGIAFLVLAISMNALAITQHDALKISFHSAGIVFLIISIVNFRNYRRNKKD